MGEESNDVKILLYNNMYVCIPPIVAPLALGVAPPSLSGSLFAAPEADCVPGEERKNSGDCVEGA
jgi:hypothetical protein